MSDTPISTVSSVSSFPSSEHDIQTLLLAQVNSLSQHHVTVSYLFVGILVLVLGLAGVGGWLGLKSYEGQVARAEAIEAKYQDAQKAFAEQLAANSAERAQDAQASAALIAQIAKRAVAPLPPVIQSGLAASAPAESVKNALNAITAPRHPDMAPSTVEGPNIVLSAPSAQQVASDLMVGYRSEQDLEDTSALLTLANRDKSTLSSDLDQCNGLNTKANASLEAYKKIAVKSRWRKFLDGALKVGLVLGGVAVGHGI